MELVSREVSRLFPHTEALQQNVIFELQSVKPIK
jgi:hypothetical protein